MHSHNRYTKDALPGGGFLKRMIFRVTIMFMALTSLCLFLRLWAKLRIGKRKLAVDDYSMLTAWVREALFTIQSDVES